MEVTIEQILRGADAAMQIVSKTTAGVKFKITSANGEIEIIAKDNNFVAVPRPQAQGENNAT